MTSRKPEFSPEQLARLYRIGVENAVLALASLAAGRSADAKRYTAVVHRAFEHIPQERRAGLAADVTAEEVVDSILSETP